MDMQLARQYAPILCFDEKEPFFPVLVGVTVFDKPGPSPSFPREIRFGEDVAHAIEYAIYWDYDIGHLYELEHAWVYVGKDGAVVDAEASFHGRYLKAILPARDNVEGSRVVLYSQPGKHAFLPRAELMYLIPNLMQAPNEGAGDAGLIQTSAFKGCYEVGKERDALVSRYLKTKAFVPSMRFARWTFPEESFITWAQLAAQVPARIEAELDRLRAL